MGETVTLCWECLWLCWSDHEIYRRLNARGSPEELMLVPMGVICSFGWLCETEGLGSEWVSAMFHSREY